MASIIPTYTEDDLFVRKAVAGSALAKMAASLARDTTRGSEIFSQQKLLEVSLAQFHYISEYKAVKTRSKGVYIPLGNTGADATIATGVTIDGVQVSDPFLFTSDPNETAINIIEAFESFTSTPEYSTELIENEIHITAVEPGKDSNGFIIDVALIAGMTDRKIHMYGGQDGVDEEENLVTQDTLEQIFNNISQITGCRYAPLGTKYK